MVKFLCILIGYFIGCISTAYIVSKAFKTDLQKKGSGNLGSTNVLRVLGLKAGLITFVGDILKGVVAFGLCRYLFEEYGVLAGIYGCAGAIIGHDFTFYLKFKGGKGIATTIGMVFGLGFTFNIWIMVTTFIIGIIAVKATGFISMGSIVFSIVIPVAAFIFGMHIEGVAVLTGLGILALWKHRENIQRLRNGTENKFAFRKTI